MLYKFNLKCYVSNTFVWNVAKFKSLNFIRFVKGYISLRNAFLCRYSSVSIYSRFLGYSFLRNNYILTTFYVSNFPAYISVLIAWIINLWKVLSVNETFHLCMYNCTYYQIFQERKSETSILIYVHCKYYTEF